jgi:hypothetical protein
MPKTKGNVRGGKGYKKTSKGAASAVREFVDPTDEMIPAMITGLTGSKDLRVKFMYRDPETKTYKERENLVTMPGIWLKRRIHPRVGDVILFTLHDFIKTIDMAGAVGIACHMYRSEEHAELYRSNHIPERWKVSERDAARDAANTVAGDDDGVAYPTPATAAPVSVTPSVVPAFTFDEINIDEI